MLSYKCKRTFTFKPDLNKVRMIVMRKMDEMEMSISLKAIKWAWSYTVVFLFIWMTYDFITTGSTGLPFILLISQNIILLGTQSLLKWKMEKDEK